MMQLVGLSRHLVGKPQTYTLTESSTDPELSCGPNTGCWCQAGLCADKGSRDINVLCDLKL